MRRREPHCRFLRALRGLAVLSASALAVGLVATACGSSRDRVGPGGECFLATDCEPGLVCVEQADKSRICSDDLSRIAGDPPERPAGDGGEADANGRDGQTPIDEPDATPTADSGSDA